MSVYYVIYNGFWNMSPPDTVCRLFDALCERGAVARILPHTDCTVQLSPTVEVYPFMRGDVALFWDKDTRLARAMEAAGVHVYNCADAIAACDDKSETHRLLSQAGIPMPETLLAPMAYTEVGSPIEPFLETAAVALGFPMIVKECFGSLGEQVYLAQNAEQLRTLAYGMHHRPFIVQRFVTESRGMDKRLYVVGDRVVAAMCRCHQTDFRANLAAGGRAELYAPTRQEAELAVQCCRVLGLDFGGVDLLMDGSVCEVNSNAQTIGITACTGVDVADEIVRYVLEERSV